MKTIVYGWFFGLYRHGSALYVFENCGHRDRSVPMGRIVRFDLAGARLAAPAVLVTGLHTNCHQIAVVDGLLCVLDTANQAILRFTLDGDAVDVQRPFAAAPPHDTSGAYLHINAIASVGDRTAIMLHNGKVIPDKTSELAWLDRDWRLIERQPLPGHSCHDIVADERGMLWHCDSMAGDIIAAGRRSASNNHRLLCFNCRGFTHRNVVVSHTGTSWDHTPGYRGITHRITWDHTPHDRVSS